MKTLRVAVNGCGRIGRSFVRVALSDPRIELVAINDIAPIEQVAYLLRFDTVYGKSSFAVAAREAPNPTLILGKREVFYLTEKEPENLPWQRLEIDVAVEASGFFASFSEAYRHLRAGAKRVVISGPAKDDPTGEAPGATVLLGVNEEELSRCRVSSNASCTTNAASPPLAILNETIGVSKALLSTVHGYTATQSLVDRPNRRGLREGRAAAANIVPTSTGAARATTKAIRDLEGKFDGISMRVPVTVGSIVDVTCHMKRETTREEINETLRRAAGEKRWEGIFTVTEEELVSSDIIGSRYASVADLSLTRVVGGDLVKVLAWYDNEMGYSYTLLEHVVKAGQLL